MHRIPGKVSFFQGVVFLDPADQYSDWLWYHHGADAERVAVSFEQQLEMATLTEDEGDDDGED